MSTAGLKGCGTAWLRGYEAAFAWAAVGAAPRISGRLWGGGSCELRAAVLRLFRRQ